MSEINFTPGPWKIKEHDMGEFIYCSQGYPLALPCDRPEHNANSHLIAAAPDLYEALERCLEALIYHQCPNTVDMVIAVMSKARGKA